VSVTLQKGQTVSLNKADQSGLHRVVMGLGWDPARSKGGFLGRLLGGGSTHVDLDASCVALDRQGAQMDQIWFRQLRSSCGSIEHTGDNLTGEGEGDDEQIIVKLDQVPQEIATLFFLVNNFTGQDFQQVASAYCRLVDADTNTELARYDLGTQGQHSALIMAMLFREPSGWAFRALGEPSQGRTFHDLLPVLRRFMQ
jgi:tellurium resistance protein TerZ